MVIQGSDIFSTTIIENIAFGEENPDPKRATTVAKIVEMHDFISSLPYGYATALGEGGINLSGGQKQRLAIARAIYRIPEVLILDEATSEIDSITEKKLLSNLKQELEHTTCITITHRMKNISQYDRIWKIEEGRIVEQFNA